MSMKRTKQRTYSFRGGDESPTLASKPQEPEKTWEQWTEGQPEQAFAAYNMKARYTKGQLLQHPTFGKGAVVAVHDSHVEVLFADARRRLGHGMT
jgi:hypothetical protein